MDVSRPKLMMTAVPATESAEGVAWITRFKVRVGIARYVLNAIMLRRWHQEE
jgi:hypothetical protein